MRLTAQQMNTGLAAVARFINPSFDDMEPGVQHMNRERMSRMMLPCLLLLPDVEDFSALSVDLDDKKQYVAEFLEAGAEFKLGVVRKEERYENYSDVDLMRRIPDSEIIESAENLRILCQIFLDAAATVAASEQIALSRMFAPPLKDLVQDFDSLPLDQFLKDLS